MTSTKNKSSDNKLPPCGDICMDDVHITEGRPECIRDHGRGDGLPKCIHYHSHGGPHQCHLRHKY